MTEPLRVFIGYDDTEKAAAEVCRHSLLKHASVPVTAEFLNIEALRRTGIYQRTYFKQGTSRYDTIDGRPFSTDFSFSRFLVPALMQYGRNGGSPWALFVDSDILFRADVKELFDVPLVSTRLGTPARAVYVVKHDYQPQEVTKMRGDVRQERYNRKNWSSVMLFNTAHHACQMLVPWHVSTASGRWLHTFEWCRDEDIGRLPFDWNWLEGHSEEPNPKLVHFTRGTPDVKGYENVPYADEWLAAWAECGHE